VRFSNYVVPPAAAAGRWNLSPSGTGAASATVRDEILDQRSGGIVSFSMERTIALLDDPPREAGDPGAVRFSGLSVQQRLTAAGPLGSWWLDAWNIMQVPVGSKMLFPLKGDGGPEVYFNASGKRTWTVTDGCVEWKVDGDAETKWGLPARCLTGRLGVLLPGHGAEATLLVWCHPVLGGMPYPDGPRADYLGDQVVQSWDGFGFGEVEYHSPAASPRLPMVQDSSVVWAFTGPRVEIVKLRDRLLQPPARQGQQ
jgi:hypothetical protein